jgi:DNA-binding MarR family transcriptional regulator
MASRLVMGQELRAAIADATRDAPYISLRELYERYFRNADWESFDRQLSLLASEGLVERRPHPEEPRDRLLGLTELARAGRVPWEAIERGRKRRGEL